MTNQVIPEEAIEAAAKKLAALNSDAGDMLTDEEWAQELLEAAVPYMLDRAYNAGHLDGMNGAPSSNPYRTAP